MKKPQRACRGFIFQEKILGKNALKMVSPSSNNTTTAAAAIVRLHTQKTSN